MDLDPNVPPPLPSGAAASPTAEAQRVRSTAQMAWGLAIAAIALAMVGPCMGYFPLLLSIPLGGVALFQARNANRSGHVDEVGRVYTQTAMVVGGLAAGWSTLVVAIVALFVMMYFGMIMMYVGLIFAVIAAAPPPGH